MSALQAYIDESQSVKNSILYAKIENLEKNAARQKETQAETEHKFVQLKKKGRLGKNGDAHSAWYQSYEMSLPSTHSPDNEEGVTLAAQGGNGTDIPIEDIVDTLEFQADDGSDYQ